MKVVFDTNIYISWIRERKFSDLLLDVRTQKYLSAYVLMELWAGTQTKQNGRIVESLQKAYSKTGRVIGPSDKDFVLVGRFLSSLSGSKNARRRNAGFINDVFIAMGAQSIGATLYTTNSKDFELISSYFERLKVVFV